MPFPSISTPCAWLVGSRILTAFPTKPADAANGDGVALAPKQERAQRRSPVPLR